MSFLDFMSNAFGSGWTWLAGQQGSGLSFKHQKALMDKQYNLSMKGTKQNLLNNYIYSRQGLENAGYNPIIAGGNVGGATNAFTAGSAPSTNMPNYTDATNALNFNLNRKVTQAQINNTNASTENINADTENKKVQNGILMADKKIRQYEVDMKKFDKDTQAYRFAMEMKEMWSRTKLNLENAMYVDYNAESQRIASNAQKLQAETSEKWTPGKIGAGLGVAALGLFGPGKLKTLKNVTKVTKRSRNGRSSISQIFNEY